MRYLEHLSAAVAVVAAAKKTGRPNHFKTQYIPVVQI